ncbi:uncharacterized protein Z518_08913 [Rhinocladiella mackenziei CBS 650.93]|uniref:Cytochrome P450 monooxygenase n=1 Tax=Rhinocladiella mackenziei CBS 650.93 TaxID=1442369 RepID=A0A0D2GS82_9EURO|nr:uncharacterized protein Z518_08913 [Rhinocladiella mackenziei CBS 650.93]KIX01188.1 hypothetical protein Z518_08913 [Rhinocladiella mackenziei CBS 650.93]
MPHLTAELILACVLLPITYYLYRAARDPLRSAPGPFLARFTRLWYLKAVHKGDFELQNIQLHRQYGPIVRVAPNWYSISDLDAAATIYNTQNVFPKSKWYFAFQQPDEPNIFSTHNNKYAAELRRKYKPAFDVFHVYEYAVDDCSKILEQRLSEFAASESEADLGWWLTCYAFDVNGQIAFSKRFGHLDEGKDVGNIAAALAERLDYVSHVGIYPSLHRLFWKLVMVMTFVTKQIDYTYVFAQNQLDGHQRRRDLETGKSSEPPDMLDRFLDFHKQNPNHFTKNDVLIGAYSSIAAGADSTWISLGSIIHYVHKYPETLRKLRAEIDMMTREGKISDPVTFEESKKMPYLNAVIKEAQRMHSPTGFPLWRVVPESGATLCGRYFPPGTTVGVNIWVAHRSSAFDPDPDIFRPERWLEADKKQLAKMNASYMPFGMGPRICQGQIIAMMEMGKIIPQLFRRFDFDLSPDWQTFNHWLVGHKGLNGKVKCRENPT